MADFDFDAHRAVLFDLDGVLTDTASLHAAAWKLMFDEFLMRWSADHGHPFEPFEVDPDYLTHVDGLPRYDGVAAFLESRRIVLPEGSADDPPDADTIHGLGTRKNDLVLRLMHERGVEPFPGAVRFVDAARDAGLETAVVSSSRNAVASLKSAGIFDRFSVIVDGVVAAGQGLPGKPSPDTYLEGARRLGVEAGEAAVVEDAVSGIEAGRLGGFRTVIGIGEGDQAGRLTEAGADPVVADLADLLD
ncbi:HAD family hydrolase [Salsipaludibacter albus]|uniref:HAD family hydrolase n=1 Tax=Salsipaludibacter albus TaxID=2849650 RepID=UPI001EE4650C|nr:beta-phosphoglucomutase family hydrolase [Salsipaludibacter albus]MBY5162439.1 beta-phosphoglucomutase family hydrolase [Salsipaludibacter albus]